MTNHGNMKKITFVLSVVFMFVLMAGCNVKQKESVVTLNETIQQTQISSDFDNIPVSKGVAGNVVYMKPIFDHMYYRLGFYKASDKRINLAVYKVDKESFIGNSRGGFATFEGYIELTKFKQKEQIFSGDLDIAIAPYLSAESEYNGYIKLPIKEVGFYYLEFHSNKDEDGSHILLEVSDNPTDFNYAN
jgi:hypothetical protein